MKRIYLRPSCFLNAFKDFAIIGATPVRHKQANVVQLAIICVIPSFTLNDPKKYKPKPLNIDTTP